MGVVLCGECICVGVWHWLPWTTNHWILTESWWLCTDNFKDVVEEFSHHFDDTNSESSDEEQLVEFFIYVNRRLDAVGSKLKEKYDDLRIASNNYIHGYHDDS